MSAYCARQDVYRIGLNAEMFRRPPREVENVVPATGTIAIRSHGFSAGDPLSLSVLSSSTLGAPAAATPTGTSVGTAYYALPSSSDLFQLSTTPSGAPLTFSDAGAGIWGVLVDHGVYLDAAIVAASALIDEYARAHAPPITAPALPLVCAYLAVRIYVASHAGGDPAFAGKAEPPSWLRSRIDKLMDLWLTGTPIVGAVDASPATSEQGAVLIPLEGRRFNVGLEEDRA